MEKATDTGKAAAVQEGEEKVSELRFWLFFSVLVALGPLVFLLIFSPSSVWDVLSHGELYIISTALAGERIGNLYVREKSKQLLSFIIFMFAFGGGVAGIISVPHQESEVASSAIRIFVLSLIILTFLVITGIINLRGK